MVTQRPYIYTSRAPRCLIYFLEERPACLQSAGTLHDTTDVDNIRTHLFRNERNGPGAGVLNAELLKLLYRGPTGIDRVLVEWTEASH